MTPELKARWISALRSPSYRQGFGRLRQGRGRMKTTDQFSAMGVLCDVIAPAKWQCDNCGGLRYWNYAGTLCTRDVPAEFCIEHGLIVGLPFEDRNGLNPSLYGLDDYCSLGQIADLVEHFC